MISSEHSIHYEAKTSASELLSDDTAWPRFLSPSVAPDSSRNLALDSTGIKLRLGYIQPRQQPTWRSGRDLVKVYNLETVHEMSRVYWQSKLHLPDALEVPNANT
ncbi:hypothetical protein KCU98_g11641, partial [Aureobasidium melanogenum]